MGYLLGFWLLDAGSGPMVSDGILIDGINTFARVLAWLFRALEPLGPVLFWALSLLALLGLMLRALRGSANGEDACGECTALPAWMEWSLVCGFTVLGAMVRLYGREALPYWWDELLAVWISGSDIPTLVRTLASPAAPGSDFTPPLFYLLLHAWQSVLGQGEGQDRIMTVLFSVLTIPAVHLLGKRLWGTVTGLGASFLLALSMTAVFFSQQVRCYSLLAFLTVLFLLSAEALFRRGSVRDVAAYLICAVLLLYTHFVATWVFAGVSIAYFLSGLLHYAYANRAGFRLVGVRVWQVSVCLAVFMLALLCPLFVLPVGQPTVPHLTLWSGVALVLLLSAAAPASENIQPLPLGKFFKYIALFISPTVCIAPWILYTRIWEVIAGKGAYNPNAYGLSEFQVAIDYFTGLELQYTLYLLLVGLLTLFVLRPRSALIICGWVVFPAALAMLAQNQNMNLVRYLFLTQAGYPVLVSVAFMAILDPLVRFTRYALRGLRPVPVGLACVLILMSLFGFVGFARISFPTQATPPEDYRGAAAFLKEKGYSCLGFENQNMLRAVSWAMLRDGGQEGACIRSGRRAFLLNVYPDGHSWAGDSKYVHWLLANSRQVCVLPGLEIREVSSTKTNHFGQGGTSVSLKGTSLLLDLCESSSLAFAGDRLYPMAKKTVARGVYEISLPEGNATGLDISLVGQAVGPESRVEVKVVLGEGENGARAVIQGSENLRADLELKKEVVHVSFPMALHYDPGTKLTIEIRLFDDGSGAVYSSNAGLAEIDIVLRRPSPFKS